MLGGSKTPRTSRSRIEVALRRAQALQMRIDGVPVAEIMEQLGYKQHGHFYQDIERALDTYVGRPAEHLRALEVARMDQQLVRYNEMAERVLEVRDREHITVNNGRVITVSAGPGEPEVPLIDDEPVLRATAQLLAIEDRRADVQLRRSKLLGLNAPAKVAVITDEALNDELVRTAAEVAELERFAAGEAEGAAEAQGEEGPASD